MRYHGTDHQCGQAARGQRGKSRNQQADCTGQPQRVKASTSNGNAASLADPDAKKTSANSQHSSLIIIVVVTRSTKAGQCYRSRPSATYPPFANARRLISASAYS